MILEYKDIPVYYKDQGQGKAVVLLHGFLENASMWKELASEIEDDYRVVTIDLLGHGQTGCLGYIHTMEMMAEAVIYVLNHLNIKTSVIIGHSMGGYVALALAEAFVDRVEGLCLMNSTPFADSNEKQINRDRAIKAVKYNHKNFIALSIANLFSSENRLRFVDEIEFIKMQAMNLPLQGVVAALEGMKVRKDRSLLLQKLPAAKVVFLGREDPVLEYDGLSVQLMALSIEIESFSGGHMSYIENKEELTHKIKHFIKI